MEIFLGASTSGKTCCRKDASSTGSCLRSSSGLADLNEPVQLEQATTPSSADFLGPSKGNLNLVTRSFQKDKVTTPSHPAEVLLNQALYPPGIYPAGHSGEVGRGDNVASEHLVNPGFEKFLNGANHVNWNGVTTQSSPNEAISQKYFNIVDRNSAAKDHLSVFPWLGCKPVDKKEAQS
ncbi:Hypothetical predicted protein [Olea europaea subsp. europaea]|uniref:Uncharacterized protein n=1 Tax=Olea europaea subsp. europaea TaxID=158383 RepID=A0A8S0UL21_OLEEU|nr:Hypothetical predicted protein [Olea europaea subsp. europaea]